MYNINIGWQNGWMAPEQELPEGQLSLQRQTSKQSTIMNIQCSTSLPTGSVYGPNGHSEVAMNEFHSQAFEHDSFHLILSPFVGCGPLQHNDIRTCNTNPTEFSGFSATVQRSISHWHASVKIWRPLYPVSILHLYKSEIEQLSKRHKQIRCWVLSFASDAALHCTGRINEFDRTWMSIVNDTHLNLCVRL